MENTKTKLALDPKHGKTFRETPKAVRVFFELMKYVVLIVGCILVVLPLIVIILGSFKGHEEYALSGVFDLPQQFTFDNYVNYHRYNDRLRSPEIYLCIYKGSQGTVPCCCIAP